ncbi:hypothetical protein D3C76_1449250 [compost metagenome]
MQDADQVTVEDAVVDHRIATHFKQVVRGAAEQAGVDQQLFVDIEVRADGGTRRHLAQHRHFEDFWPTQRFGQANAPRLVRRDIDITGLAQGGDVLARNAARSKTEARGDIGQARWLP